VGGAQRKHPRRAHALLDMLPAGLPGLQARAAAVD